MEPPKNYEVGLTRSLRTRTERSERLDNRVWQDILSVVIFFQTRTLQEIAEAMNSVGSLSRRGRQWTAGMVHHEIRARGLTAKQLYNRVTQPPTKEVQPRPAVRYKRWMSQVGAVEEQGQWLPVTHHAAHITDLVRHPEFQTGQIIRVESNGRFRCRFLAGTSTFDKICAATELEVFQHRFSREERQRKSGSAAEDLSL